MLLCLALVAGFMPMISVQASESGSSVPGLAGAQVMNSCQIVLVFDQAITYAGGEMLPPFLGSESGELPPLSGGGAMPPVMPPIPGGSGGACGLLPGSGGHEGITVAPPGGDALDIGAVIPFHYGLILVLEEPLGNQELLDISMDEGVVQFSGSEAPFELSGYRVMTPLGILGLMDRLDPQRSGFQVGHAVKYMKGTDSISVAGMAGLDQEDARFLLSLIESGPVDKSELNSLISIGESLLESGEGYAQAERERLQSALAAARQTEQAATASHREVRAQTVTLERATVAFSGSFEMLAPLAGPVSVAPAPGSVLADGRFNEADRSALGGDAQATLEVVLPAASESRTAYRAGDRVVVTAGPGTGAAYVLTEVDAARLANESITVQVNVSNGYLMLMRVADRTVIHEVVVMTGRIAVPDSPARQAVNAIRIDTLAPEVRTDNSSVEYTGTIEATSSEASVIVLVPAAQEVSGPEALRDEQGAYLYPAREVNGAGVLATFGPADWEPGEYKVYGVDSFDNLSEPVYVLVGHPDSPVIRLQADASPDVELPASPNPEVLAPYGMTVAELAEEQLEINNPYTIEVLDREGMPVEGSELLAQGMRLRISAPFSGEWTDYHVRLQAVAGTLLELREGLERLEEIDAIKLTADIVEPEAELTLYGDAVLRATGLAPRVLEVRTLDVQSFMLTRSGVELVFHTSGDEELTTAITGQLPDRIQISGLAAEGYSGVAGRSPEGTFYYTQDPTSDRINAYVSTPGGLQEAWTGASHIYLTRDITLPDDEQGQLSQSDLLVELAASEERVLSAAGIAEGWEANRVRVVVIDRGLPGLSAVVSSVNLGDGAMYGFRLTFDAPVSKITRDKGTSIIESITLRYESEDEDELVNFEDFTVYWFEDNQTVEIHKSPGTSPFGLLGIEVTFADELIVSQAGAVYDTDVPVIYTLPLPLQPPSMMELARESILGDGMLNIAEYALLDAGQATAAIEVELPGGVAEGYAAYQAGDQVVVRVSWEDAGYYELTAADIAVLQSEPLTISVDVSDYLLAFEEGVEWMGYARAWVESAGSHADDSDGWYEELMLYVDLKAPTVTGAPEEEHPYHDPLTVSSDESGAIVLVPGVIEVSSLDDLYADGAYLYPYQMVDGRGAYVWFEAGDWLEAGSYNLFAVDEAGNLSVAVPVTIAAAPAELTAEIGNYVIDGPLYSFDISFNEPILESVRGLENGIVDRVELHYGEGSDPVILEASAWSLFWDNSQTLNLHNGEGIPWMGLESVSVYFVDHVLVSEGGARYPAGVPLHGIFNGPGFPEEPGPDPVYVIAGAPLTEGPNLYHLQVKFSKPLVTSENLLREVEVHYINGDPVTYLQGEAVSFNKLGDDEPNQSFELSFHEYVPDLRKVSEILVYFTDAARSTDEGELFQKYAVYRPVDIQTAGGSEGELATIYLPPYTSGWTVLDYLALQGYDEVVIYSGDEPAERAYPVTSGMSVRQGDQLLFDIGIHRHINEAAPLAEAFRNTTGVDRIKYAFSDEYYERHSDGYFWEPNGQEAYILHETDFRTAANDGEIQSIRLLEDLTFQESFAFPNRELRFEGEQVTLSIPGIDGYDEELHAISESITVVDTSLEAPPRVAYMPEYTYLYQGWSTQFGFTDALTEEQQEKWLPLIHEAIVAEHRLADDDITVELHPQDDRAVRIVNQTDRFLDFQASDVYVKADLTNPFSPRGKVMSMRPLFPYITLLNSGEPATTRFAISFNKKLHGTTLGLNSQAIFQEISYFQAGQGNVSLMDQIVEAQWLPDGANDMLLLTIAGFTYDEENPVGLTFIFRDNVIRDFEGYGFRPQREFYYGPTA